MLESNQSNQTEAFWNTSKDGSGETYTRLSDDKEIDVEKLKARFRHRVVGVIVLVAALVTVLPIFFEEPAIEGDRHAQTAIPPIAKEPFYKMELAVNERPRPSPPADQSALRDLSKPNVVTDAPEAHPTPELEQSQAAQSYAPRTDGSLYIQVLATSSEDSVNQEAVQAIRNSVDQVLAGSKITNKWVSEDGTLWVLVKIEKLNTDLLKNNLVNTRSLDKAAAAALSQAVDEIIDGPRN